MEFESESIVDREEKATAETVIEALRFGDAELAERLLSAWSKRLLETSLVGADTKRTRACIGELSQTVHSVEHIHGHRVSLNLLSENGERYLEEGIDCLLQSILSYAAHKEITTIDSMRTNITDLGNRYMSFQWSQRIMVEETP